ncbi:fibrobacter succinogenes major paralogous domain-containing protein [Sphingobacterium chungjuense]|uniref:hypothetical protein n=1 Tax=Sphingobacterium chungjuense TaxID=2675553 RepID=UPI00140CC148|nr:hypothetical protein [Sphingobacterium chungjuense]
MHSNRSIGSISRYIAVLGLPICLTAVSLFQFACKKASPELAVKGDGTHITFDWVGVDETVIDESSDLRKATVSDRDNNKPALDVITATDRLLEEHRIELNDGTEAVVNFSEIANSSLSIQQDSEKNLKNIGTFSRAAALENVPSGIAYRLVLFNNTSGAYVATINAISGTSFTFTEANRNTTYRWFAYSQNSTIPYSGEFNVGNPQITVAPTENGLFYASGIFTTSDVVNGDNKLNITFQRKVAAIEIVVDVRGLFSTINNINARTNSASDLKSGTFNLNTGQYVEHTNSTDNTVSNASFVRYNASLLDSVKRAQIYTTDSQNPIQNLQIILTNVNIDFDLGGTRNFSDLVFSTGTNILPQLGKRYRITITLIASAQSVSNVGWARANLFYRPADGGYRFRHNSSHLYGTVGGNPVSTSAANGEFFNWRARTAVFNAAPNQIDPCNEAYPRGRWKLPTQAEAQLLANVTATTGFPRRRFERQSSATETIRYTAYAIGAGIPNDPYELNWITFLSYGRRNQGNYLISEFNDEDRGPAYSYHWTSTANGTNAMALRMMSNTANSASGTVTLVAQNTSNGFNVRCVRNNSWTTAAIPALPPADY